MSIKLKIQSLWDGKGAKDAQAELGKVEAAAKKTETTAVSGASKIGGAYKRLSSTMQSAWRAAMGPLAVITAAIAVITRAVQAWRRAQEELRREQEALAQQAYETKIDNQAKAMGRLERSIREATDAARTQSQERLEDIEIAEQAALAEIELQRAKALAAADTDDDVTRDRIGARYDSQAAAARSQFGSQRRDAQVQDALAEAARAEADLQEQRRNREQAEADLREQQAQLADLEAERANQIGRSYSGLGGRAASLATLNWSDDAHGRRAERVADRRYAEPIGKAKSAFEAAQQTAQQQRDKERQLEEQVRQARLRAERIEQIGDVTAIQDRTTGITAAARTAEIDRRERDRRAAARREAEEAARREAIAAGRAALEPEIGAAQGRVSLLASRREAALDASRDPAARPAARARSADQAAQLTRELSQAHQALRQLETLLRDEAQIIQRFAQNVSAQTRQTTNALKRNDA